MVFIAPFIGAAVILSKLVAALPQPVINGDVERRSSDYQSSNSKSSQGSSYGSSDNSNSYGSSSNYGSSNSYDSGSSNYGSSKSDSSYGGSKSNSYGGSSESGSSYSGSKSNSYGSGSSNNSGSNKDTTSSMMEESTSTMMEESTSTMMEEATSTRMSEATSTAVSYGSGSSNWNDYDNCVQQCMASFPASSGSMYTAPIVNSGSSEGSSGGSSGSGATITVIVAPMQGVLRMVPFAVNASVGDTVKFMWGANNHTITKGSQLEPCNKTSDAFFTSGTHDKGFVFNQVVNDTNPTFFFCNTPGHCQKGMFGVINPLTSFGAPTSASGMMQSLTSANLDLKTYASITDKATAGTGAELWGGSIDMAGMPDWAHEAAAEGILYTRNLMAQNPEIMRPDGSVDLSSVDGTPLSVPLDVAAVLAQTGSTSTSAPVQNTAAAAGAAATTADPAGAAASAPANNGAGALASPRVLVALMAAVATFFIL